MERDAVGLELPGQRQRGGLDPALAVAVGGEAGGAPLGDEIVRFKCFTVLDCDPVPLCRAWSDFETFPCAIGSTVWCATEGGDVVRAAFAQG